LKKREAIMKMSYLKRKRPEELVNQQQHPVASKKWMDEMALLKEENGMVCVVCQEGYRSKPHQILSVYVYCKSARLPYGAKFIDCVGQCRIATQSTWAVSTASSFVCIHSQCHDLAARADRAHAKAPKDEWEGAALRNGHVKCNNLLPLRGTATISTYDSAVQGYFERVDRDTKAQVTLGTFSFFSFCAHDLRFLLLRVSFGENLSEDTNGGGLESNLKLVVPLVQMASFLLDSDRTQRSRAEALVEALVSGQVTFFSLFHL